MLIYLAAPYSNVVDRKKLMKDFLTYAGQYMVNNPTHVIVSPLFNHFCLEHVPELGTDWNFWKNYSEILLLRCDKIIVLGYLGWKESLGVQAEINFAEDLQIAIEIVQF